MKILTKHLKENKITYSKHMFFSLKLSFKFFILSLTSFLHSLFPFIFTDKASNEVSKLSKLFLKRNLERLKRCGCKKCSCKNEI